MGPLCLLTYVAYKRGWSTRFVLATLSTTLQFAGAVVFAVVEALTDFPNTPVDRGLEFTEHHCLYFWFGYGANYIWMVIPVLIVWHALSGSTTLAKAKVH